MSYRGKDKFKSTFGGIISLALLIFIVCIFGYKLRDMVLRN